MKKIYTAGPEVFLPWDLAQETLAKKKELCTQYGYEGVTPFDAGLTEIDNTLACGLRIAQANEDLIDACDYVVANLTPFRSKNADPGTVFEVGYARAAKKQIWGYTYGIGKHAVRIGQGLFCGNTKVQDGFLRERYEGTSIDDFGMVENAMIDGGILSSGGEIVVIESSSILDTKATLSNPLGFEMCLRKLREHDDNRRRQAPSST